MCGLLGEWGGGGSVVLSDFFWTKNPGGGGGGGHRGFFYKFTRDRNLTIFFMPQKEL